MKGLTVKAIWGPTGLVVATALWPVMGYACGVCDEDKVAVVYDHAVVQQAVASGNVVVFCDVRGSLDLTRLKSVARSVRGIKADSIRVSQQPAALSFVVDTKTLAPQDAVKDMQRALGDTMLLGIVHLHTPELRSTR